MDEQPLHPVPMADLSLREMNREDWPAVRVIYAEGIATGLATFETDVPVWKKWDQDHLTAGRLVAAPLVSLAATRVVRSTTRFSATTTSPPGFSSSSKTWGDIASQPSSGS